MGAYGFIHGTIASIADGAMRGIVKIGLHAVVGGAVAMAQGGSFESGAFTGAISAGSSLAMDESGSMGHSGDGDAGNIAARTAVAAIAGGTASMLSGGKFANGAITGAFAQLYNADGGNGAVDQLFGNPFSKWFDVLGGAEQAGKVVGNAATEMQAAAIPGASLMQCAMITSCGGSQWGLAALGAIPGFKYEADGLRVIRFIQSSVGELTVGGRISVAGTRLIVDDIIVWASNGEKFAAGALGTRGTLEAAKPLFSEAKSLGFTEVQLTGLRVSGATPGRTAEFTIDLNKR